MSELQKILLREFLKRTTDWEKYLQITKLKEEVHPEYLRTAQNPVLRKTIQF